MKQQAILFAAGLILAVAISILPSPFIRYPLTFILLWLLPGLCWALLISGDDLDRVEWLTVGMGLNFVITPLVSLVVTYLPGPVTQLQLLAATVLSIGLPMVLSVLSRREPPSRVPHPNYENHTSILRAQHPFWREGWVWLLVAILIAGGLRLVNLDYAEFGSDEAKILLRGSQALVGNEDIIFQHKKGPSQITTMMIGWRLTGITNEWMARLPFTWASILAVVAMFLWGRRLRYPRAGGIAACLLAIEGYHVGLGRGLKYHSLVTALSTLGLLCLLIYYASGRRSLVIAGAVLFAGGVLAHYDAFLALPAGLFLIGARLWRDRGRFWQAAVPVIIAGLVGAALLGTFYVPFWRSPYVEFTATYVSGRVGGHIYNNLGSTFELSAVYNSIYFLSGLTLALMGQNLISWAKWGRLAPAISGLLLLAAASGFLWPERWMVEGLTLAWAPFAVLLLGAFLAPNQLIGIRAAWLWLGVPAIFYLFLVAIPLTHVYTFFPAWAMLAGVALDNLGRWLLDRSRALLHVAIVGGIAIYALCVLYAVTVFVDYTPEYLRSFPQSQISLYWTPYEKTPKAGLYGFPYRVGWKVIGYLMDQGELTGSYASNEKWRATTYYTRQALRLDCASPDMYVIATDVQDEVPVRWDQLEADYRPAAIVSVNDQPRLTVYRRGEEGPTTIYRAEDYERPFDLGTTPERVAEPTYPEIDSAQMARYVSGRATIGDFALLRGYKVNTEHATPGGYVELTLLWQALKSPPIDYQVFTHLYDGEVMRGQLDGPPVCGNLPTSEWQTGQMIVDPYRIPIKPDTPVGPVPLTIGMYNLVTMERLPVTVDSSLAGDNIHLLDVKIQSP